MTVTVLACAPVSALDTAVPLWMMRVALTSGVERDQVARRATRLVREAGGPSLVLCQQIPSPAFDALASWLAVRALRPGGVNFESRHWCTAGLAHCNGEPVCVTAKPVRGRSVS
jgi:hypothetical protein